MKLVAQLGTYPPLIEEIVARYKRSNSLDLQQVYIYLHIHSTRNPPRLTTTTIVWLR